MQSLGTLPHWTRLNSASSLLQVKVKASYKLGEALKKVKKVKVVKAKKVKVVKKAKKTTTKPKSATKPKSEYRRCIG